MIQKFCKFCVYIKVSLWKCPCHKSSILKRLHTTTICLNRVIVQHVFELEKIELTNSDILPIWPKKTDVLSFKTKKLNFGRFDPKKTDLA